MPTSGNVSTNGSRILQLLRSGCRGYLLVMCIFYIQMPAGFGILVLFVAYESVYVAFFKTQTSSNSKSVFEEKFLSQQSQNSGRWPIFLCVCSVFSSGSVQLHWSQWPSNQSSSPPKWFCTSKGLLGVGPSAIMAADAIIMDNGSMHVAGVPIVNLSIAVVWEVTPGSGNGFQATPKTSTSNGGHHQLICLHGLVLFPWLHTYLAGRSF